jgi:hypothetical protein
MQIVAGWLAADQPFHNLPAFVNIMMQANAQRTGWSLAGSQAVSNLPEF